MSEPTKAEEALAQIEERLVDAEIRMEKSVEALHKELSGIRTGRASPSLVERLQVEAYGVPTPLQSLAGISTPEARLLVIRPYDRASIRAIEKAIQRSDLGLTPSNDGAADPDRDPPAHRGAPPRAEQALRPPGRGGPGGGAQHPPRRGRAPPQGREGGPRQPRRRGGLPRPGPADHRPVRRPKVDEVARRRRRRSSRSRAVRRSGGPEAHGVHPPRGVGHYRSLRETVSEPGPFSEERHAPSTPAHRHPRARPAPTCPGTSASSWTATAAGPGSVTSPGWPAIAPGSGPSVRSWRPATTPASTSSPSTPSAPRTGSVRGVR